MLDTNNTELCHWSDVYLELSKALKSEPWVPKELARLHSDMAYMSMVLWHLALDAGVDHDHYANSIGVYLYCGHLDVARDAERARAVEEIKKSIADGSADWDDLF